MKRFIMITSLLVTGSFGADLSQVSTEELADEMQKRMQSMTPQERQQYRGSGMMRPGRMMQMPKFSDCDLNSDGAITEEEFKEARAKRMEKRAAEGRMLRNAGMAPAFSDIDTNKDQKITPDEFQTHQQQMRMKKSGKCGNGMMGQGKMRPGRMMQMPQFSDYDLNNDGVIMKKELQEARTERMNQRAKEGRMLQNAGMAPSFEEIDTNKDQKITPDEFQAHQQQMRMKNKNFKGKCDNGKCGR
jgi:Ca2+-binding EF-hand superfamily protein